jgi:hypothetical protein
MRRKWIEAVAALGLSGASVIGLPATAASAHHHDDMSVLSCVIKRPFPDGWPFQLIHAHPLAMTEHYVIYGCYAEVLAAQWCRWEVIAYTAGGFEGPVNVTGSRSGCG